MHIDGARCDIRTGTMDRTNNLLAAQHLPRMLHQEEQDTKFYGPEQHWLVRHTHLVTLRMHCQSAIHNHPGCLPGAGAPPEQRRLNMRQQEAWAEWPGQIYLDSQR